MRRKRKKRPLWHPFHWPTWVALGFFRLLVFLPWKIQVGLGKLFGPLFFAIVRERRSVVMVNLRLCFPEKSEEEIRTLAKEHYQAMGIGLFETCLAWWAPFRRIPPYEIVGREHLEEASARGKGVILFTAHFTTLEICGRMFAENFPLGCLYRDPDNAVVAYQMHKRRLQKMTAAVSMNDLRGLIRALRQGHTIWYASDQGKRTKFSTVLPFFGVPAMTNTAASRIAEMTGSAVVPYFAARKPDGSYLLTVLPALENFPTSDPEADAIRTNRLMEEYIRKAPEQYFWVHRRFKRRGKEFPNVYR